VALPGFSPERAESVFAVEFSARRAIILPLVFSHQFAARWRNRCEKFKLLPARDLADFAEIAGPVLFLFRVMQVTGMRGLANNSKHVFRLVLANRLPNGHRSSGHDNP
jgi:hypothetical protein